MRRKKHPKKDVEDALRELEDLGWLVEEAKGGRAHAWGSVKCPANKMGACRSGIYCRMAVFSTPRNPENHARGLIRKAEGCLFKLPIEGNGNG